MLYFSQGIELISAKTLVLPQAFELYLSALWIKLLPASSDIISLWVLDIDRAGRQQAGTVSV